MSVYLSVATPKPQPAREFRDSGIKWLGAVPATWRVVPTGFLATVQTGSGDTADAVENGKYPFYVRSQTVQHIGSWEFDGPAVLTAGDGAGVGKVYHLADGRFSAHQRVYVLNKFKDVLPEFFYLYFSAWFARIVVAGTAKSTVESLRRPMLTRFPISVPPLPEQRQIVEYLNRETGQLDALIAKQEQLLEMLAERRQAVIAQAVTRGLDPTVELKDSGVEWIGLVPSHWGVKQIKHLSPVRRGASPRPIADSKYFDDEGEWAWVRIADVSSSTGRLIETTQTLSELGSSLSVKLEPGSLFVSIAGTVGKPCITEIKACIHDGFVYFPNLRYSTDLLARIFEAGRCYAGLGKMGTQLNLNTDTIGSIRIPVPPVDEQKRIVDYLRVESRRIAELSAKAQQVVEVLRERRQALIGVAVTGKIDVRGL